MDVRGAISEITYARVDRVASKKKATTIRLERGDAGSRVFWEITRDGASFTTRFGRHLNAGRVTPAKKFASASEAEAAMAAAVAAKRSEGYAEPVARAASGSTSRKGVSVRNPELEAIIDEDPADAERYLVYADWLAEQGDPRGELIIVQHGLATTPDSPARSRLERDERELFAKFKEELLGKYAEHTFLRNSMRSFRTFSWRYGFIRAARLGPLMYTRLDVADVLADLCAHPSGRFLEHLIVGRVDSKGKLMRVLRERTPPTLRSLVVGDCEMGSSILDGLWAAMPNLRRFAAAMPIERFGEFVAPALESLSIIAANVRDVPAVMQAKAPKLRSLRITLTGPFDPKAVSSVLEPFPTLEELSIQRWKSRGVDPSRPNTSEQILVPEDDLALTLVARAAERRLKRLDLEIPMSARGVERLQSRIMDIREIGLVRIPSEAIESEVRPRLTAPNIEWTDSPSVEELDLPEISA